MSHPQSYEILLVPEFDESGGAPAPGTAIRSGVVAATGETGASGYPRYAGDGIEADIDPMTRTVEALLVDGAELDYSLSVRIAARAGGVTVEGTDDVSIQDVPAELADEPPEPAERPDEPTEGPERPEGPEGPERPDETAGESADRPGERT